MSEAKRDLAFRRIQVHEAEVAHCQARLHHDLSRAPTEVPALCAASDALCAESSRLRDPDATARCQRAGDTCTAARALTPP